jgi:uroporphyrinogen decarboxylase
LNAKERFQAIMHYQPTDRLPLWDLEGVTEQAVRRWCLQGMPIGVDVREYIGFDPNVLVPLATTPIPPFIGRALQSDAEWVTYVDEYGFTVRRSRSQAVPPTVYFYLSGSMRSLSEWEGMKQRYNPHDIRRYPNAWGPELFQHYRDLDCPVGIWVYWGPGRGSKNGYMLGFEPFLYMLADNPDALQPVFEFSANFLIELCRELLENVPLDYAILMEDGMAYKNSTLVSPDMYRRLWMPHQRRVTDFWRSKGIDVIGYYTSGNLEPLIPVLMETGFNMFAPLERAADMDAVQLRGKYGRDALFMGNIGRQALQDGPEAIDAEFRALRPAIESGGFIPVVDDMILPDISFQSYMHYVQAIRSYRFGS